MDGLPVLALFVSVHHRDPLVDCFARGHFGNLPFSVFAIGGVGIVELSLVAVVEDGHTHWRSFKIGRIDFELGV